MTKPTILRSSAHLWALAAVALAVLSLGAAGAASPTPVPGGANQRPSVEGCINQTLFDGFWRFKASGIALVQEPGMTSVSAWAVPLELKNARSEDTTPALVGLKAPQLILADGTVLEMDVESSIAFGRQVGFMALPPGATGHGTFYFRPESSTSKPDKLLLGIDPLNPTSKVAWGYPLKDPSFRVHLNCTK